jgi:hypothetical protein
MPARWLLPLALITPAALADDVAPVVQQSFTPKAFSEFAPLNALDLVSRVPGFRVQGGGGGRGFGQAKENVLINGQRVSGKSVDVFDALRRIPVAAVVRIDIVEGASLDIPGLSGQVANVITRETGLSGTWVNVARIRENLPPYFDDFLVTVSREGQRFDWSLSLDNDPIRGANRGRERITDAAGAVLEFRDEDLNNTGSEQTISGALAWRFDGGAVLHLNGQLSLLDFNRVEKTVQRAPDESLTAFLRALRKEDSWDGELAGDFALDLGAGRLKLIALARGETGENGSFLTLTPNRPDPERLERFEEDYTASEAILRGEYGWSAASGRDWQVSLETAFNRLETDSVFSVQEGAETSRFPLGTTEVEEIRGEGFVTVGDSFGEALTAQLSVGVEVSEISQPGIAGSARRFTRPKGSLNLGYKQDERTSWSLSLERRVGQLDFFDFAASVDVEDGNDEVGNPDLVPDQRWHLEAELERKLGAQSAVTLNAFAQRIEDEIELVPLGNGTEGVGNIDTAERFGVRLDASLELDRLGLAGGELDLSGLYRWTGIDDPVTGQRRRLNGETIWRWTVDVRQDVPGSDIAWGFSYREAQNGRRFRLTNASLFEAKPGFASVFVEHKDLFGTTARVTLGNILDQDDQFSRTVFTPDRTGEVLRVEDNTRNFGPYLTFSFEGRF